MRLERLRAIARRIKVVREIFRSCVLVRLEGFGDVTVQRPALGLQKVGDDALASESVAEREDPTFAQLDDELRGDRGPQLFDQRVLGYAGDPRQQIEIESLADHRRRAQDAHGVGIETAQPAIDGVTHRIG